MEYAGLLLVDVNKSLANRLIDVIYRDISMFDFGLPNSNPLSLRGDSLVIALTIQSLISIPSTLLTSVLLRRVHNTCE